MLLSIMTLPFDDCRNAQTLLSPGITGSLPNRITGGAREAQPIEARNMHAMHGRQAMHIRIRGAIMLV